MARVQIARKAACPYCGTKHDRHEDAYCGCGCGSEPMGCAECMRDGGPPRRYDADGYQLERRSYNYDMDDPDYYPDEE